MSDINSTNHQEIAPNKRRRRWLPRLVAPLVVAISGLYLLSLTAKPPTGLGITNGRLALCPDSPNCVSTQTESDSHRMDPIPCTCSSREAKEKLKSVIAESFSRANLVEESANYLRYEFTSLIFRFVDDVEFLIEPEQQLVHFRSASRVGYSDMGANRKRLTTITNRMNQPNNP